MLGGLIFSYETAVVSAHGEVVPVQVQAVPSTFAGQPVRVAGIRDLRPTRRLEAERRRLEQCGDGAVGIVRQQMDVGQAVQAHGVDPRVTMVEGLDRLEREGGRGGQHRAVAEQQLRCASMRGERVHTERGQGNQRGHELDAVLSQGVFHNHMRSIRNY